MPSKAGVRSIMLGPKVVSMAEEEVTMYESRATLQSCLLTTSPTQRRELYPMVMHKGELLSTTFNVIAAAVPPSRLRRGAPPQTYCLNIF
jgi:hypothetical protein